MVYAARGDKYFILSDSYGYLTILKRDGSFRSRLYSGSPQVLNFDRFSLNTVFVTPNQVGFIKFQDSSIGTNVCDVGRQ
jgi:hypothetical protein